MTKRDYYEIFGVDRSADTTEIKRAYRNLAMKYHPDRNPEDAQAAEKMKEINEAYAVLSDADKRRRYDTYGHTGLEGLTQEDIFRGVDFSSLFREFGFGFGDSIFDSLFGRTTATRGPQKGTDLRYNLTATLEEVATGTEKKIEVPRTEKCPACGGSGAEPGGIQTCDTCRGSGQLVREQRSSYTVLRQITVCPKCRGGGRIVTRPCPECKGKGAIKKTREIAVKVPAGAETEFAIKIEGEGAPDGGIPGDLYVVLNVEKHPVFERHGDDIYVEKEIGFTTAALGGKIKVHSLKGDIQLDIPEGTQTGMVFRIDNAGIPHLNRRGRGDQYVVVKVVTPTKLTHKEKELLRQLEKLEAEPEKK